MLAKLFESLYLKVFINIVVTRSKSIVYTEMCSHKGEVVKSEEHTFATTSVDTHLQEYIGGIAKESPYVYISLLDGARSQGALPACSNSQLSKFIDLDSSTYLCFENIWSFYTSKAELNHYKKVYEKTGLDFIFSPFVLLSHFFKDKIASYVSMFILVEDPSLTVAIFENGKLLYAEHIDMQNISADTDMMLLEEGEDEDMDILEESSIDLESVDVLDDDMLDDFGNIEDLDEIEEIDDFSEAKDIEEELSTNVLADEVSSSDATRGFNEDYQRFLMIQTSVNHFYKDPRYESKFVESVYIADSVGVSADLKRYLEEEMFLSVYVRHIDLPREVCDLAKSELA
ncbi:MAG: hypothetical protein IE916_09700 [Epsilonproteobacteria bacterium]|nr:hypothetical protein [Campylobacterota bacterium]